MFATTLVVTLLLGLSTGVMSQSQLRRAAEERNLAMVACRNTVEQLRDTSFAQLASLNGTGFDVPGPNGAAHGLRTVPGDADGLAGSFTVAVDQTSGTETIYLVTLSVDWVGVRGRQQFQVRSLFAERKRN